MINFDLNQKIAIVTGRGFESIRYSLKDLLDEFNASIMFTIIFQPPNHHL